MEPFATIQDYQDLIQSELTGLAATAIDHALLAVSQAIRNTTEQTISLVEDDTIILNGNGRETMLLPQIPIVAVTQVTFTDRNAVVTDVTADIKLYDAAAGIIFHPTPHWGCDDCFPWGVQNVTVTYTHGYATIPDDLKNVTILAAKHLVQQGLTATNLQSQTVGPFTDVYQTSSVTAGDLEPFMGVIEYYRGPRIPVG